MLGPNQKALVTALESGTYPQIPNFLHTEQGYCVLGVACDVHHQATPTQPYWTHPYGTYVYYYMDNSVRPPTDVHHHFALHTDDGQILKYHLPKTSPLRNHDNLMEANDAGVTFPEIAQAMRKHPKAFFYETR